MNQTIKDKTTALIDALKATCQTYGMGNDGNEYKIITQVFLYKYLNDKFGYELKKLSKKIADAPKWEEAYSAMSDDERDDLMDRMNPDVPCLNPEHLISVFFTWESYHFFHGSFLYIPGCFFIRFHYCMQIHVNSYPAH